MSRKSVESNTPHIVSRDLTVLSPWVTLEAISVAASNASAAIEIYHALRLQDYVNVLVMTPLGEMVLVRQFRPVIGDWTLELPGGLREAEESPSQTVTRELKEETGFQAIRIVPLIEGYADVGRLTNRFFGFFALATQASREVEQGITTVILGGQELKEHAASGRIASQNQMGLLYLASINPDVRRICQDCGLSEVPWLGPS